MDESASGAQPNRNSTASSSDSNLVPLSGATPLPGGIPRASPCTNALDRCFGSARFGRWIYVCHQVAFYYLSGRGGLVPLSDFLVLYSDWCPRAKIHSPEYSLADGTAFCCTLPVRLSLIPLLLDACYGLSIRNAMVGNQSLLSPFPLSL